SSRSFIQSVVINEEKRFADTLHYGMKVLQDNLDQLRARGSDTIQGDLAFKLYDTYGFPVDLTAVMARERGLEIDEAGFEKELAQQRERSKAGSDFAADFGGSYPASEFVGYNDNFDTNAEVIYANRRGELLEVVLDKTPFYAESGGQIGDTGKINLDARELKVVDTKKVGDSAVHLVDKYEGNPASLKGEAVEASVDGTRQKHTQRNHTATHLLHKALRTVLGEHVQQAGSLVAPDRLRFDFSHFRQVTDAEVQEIERLVNEQILADKKVSWREMPIEEAKKTGAMMLFGEKYGDQVRLVEVEGYSKELCGGTHVQRTGEIGLFVIVSESAIAAGMRRIEAFTGAGALEYLNQRRATVDQIVQTLKIKPEDLVDRVEGLLAETKTLRKEVEKKQAQAATSNVAELFDNASEINGVKVVFSKFVSRDELNSYADYTKPLDSAAIGVFYNDENQYAVTTSGVAIKLGFSAKEIIAHLNKETGGRGGGRDYFTQGGTDTSLDEKKLRELVLPLIEKAGK
ncbi:MAG: alanine--tRNA ligase-related protein, partial [bacterium]